MLNLNLPYRKEKILKARTGTWNWISSVSVEPPHSSSGVDAPEHTEELSTGLMTFEGICVKTPGTIIAGWQGEMWERMWHHHHRLQPPSIISPPSCSLQKKNENLIKTPRQAFLSHFLNAASHCLSRKKKIKKKILSIIMRFRNLSETNAAIASRGRCGFLKQDEFHSWMLLTVRWIERSLLHLLVREQTQQPGRRTANRKLGVERRCLIWFQLAPYKRSVGITVLITFINH